MNTRQYRAFITEMTAVRRNHGEGNWPVAEHHLGRAHVLGARWFLTHVQVHWWGLRVSWGRRDATAIRFSLLQLMLALPFSLLGLTPRGNDGAPGTGLREEMPVPEDLEEIMGYR